MNDPFGNYTQPRSFPAMQLGDLYCQVHSPLILACMLVEILC